jgi:N-acetylglucosaminyldiphosphoundecaprenol N-acetyl-beta-D-mannosaminyltransferase
MRSVGLEWLYRLVQDPRRLARRYVVGNSQFIWLVARERVRGVGRLRS